MYTFMIISYVCIAVGLWFNYSHVKRAYNVEHNGSKWIVRDNKGRFVRLSKSVWDMLAVVL